MYISIILAIVIMFFLKNLISGDSLIQENKKKYSLITNDFELIETFVIDKINNNVLLKRYIINALNNLNINIYELCSILYCESKLQIKAGYRNKDVVGDGGKSYGYFQIQNIACEDVNEKYNYSYKHKDLLESEALNFAYGAMFYSLCKNHYMKGSRKNGFKRYNGSQTYADIAENAYNNFISRKKLEGLL